MALIVFINTRFPKVRHLGYTASFWRLRRWALPPNIVNMKMRLYNQGDVFSGRNILKVYYVIDAHYTMQLSIFS
jgi:hypothetical protein